MKRICACLLTASLLLCLCLAYAACGETDVYQVGVLQLTRHDALDAATQGFCDALAAELGQDRVRFDIQNASGEPTQCATIANTFVSKRYDLILANGTAALQAAANATLEIPILGTSITDYKTALKLSDFYGTVGGNISGTSDLAPLDQQVQMILELVPQPACIGLLYCSAEPNSKYQIDIVRARLIEEGIAAERIKDYSFSDSNDLSAVTAAAASACDVLYIPTDNTAANAASLIYSAMGNAKKPIIAGEESTCKYCGIATLTISYYDLGYETGRMAAQILRGDADIAALPIAYAPRFTKKYNATICREMGITPPDDYTVIAGTELP